MRPVLFLVAVCVLAGCSNRAIYENLRYEQRNECPRLPPTMFDECMARASMTYDEYQRERRLVLDGAPNAFVAGVKTRIETPMYEECVAFYRDVLGLSILDEWNDAGDRGAILGFGPAKSGEAFIEIAHSESMADHEGISLQFRVSDLEGMAKRLEGRWAFKGPEARPWGSRYLYLQDPAGVQVILYEGDL